MRNALRSSFMGLLIKINIGVLTIFLISKLLTSAANSVGNFGFKVLGIRFPGSLLKGLIGIVKVPFDFIGRFSKVILVIDAVLVIIGVILMILKRMKKKNMDSGTASEQEPVTTKRGRFSRFMNGFR